MNDTIPNPYVGPRTFKEEESHLFFGRGREALDLVSLVISERLVLFYAQSGAGKSSLINTKLIPGLRAEEEYNVLPVGRVGGGESSTEFEINNIYIYNLLNSLLKHDVHKDVLPKLQLTEFLGSLLKRNENSDLRHVLIVDQFEELFSMYPEAWEKREDFFMQVAQAMKDFPRLWIVLVMREDYIANLDPYIYLLPGRLRVRYYMQRLEREGALKAVREPAKGLRPYAEGVAEQLVENLAGIKVPRSNGDLDVRAGQFIEPLQLQVVCQYLWEHLPPGTQITFDELRLIGDVDQILVKYYDGRVSKVAEEKKVSQRLIRKWFEEEMITGNGLRNLVLRGQNASGGLNNAVIEALLGDLVRAERRGGAVFYEITHDRLVEPIRASNKKWFEENLSPLQRQALLWYEHKRNESWLFADQALVEVEQWAKNNPDEVTEIEEDFIKASQEHQYHVTAQRETHRRELEAAEKFAAEQKRLKQRAGFFAWLAAGGMVLALLFAWRWAQQTVNAKELAAETLVQDAANLHDTGMYEESINKLLLAQELDSNVLEKVQDASILNKFCSEGSLFGNPPNPQNVKDACERAVTLSSNNGEILDNRGINRVLLGDYQGAIKDFELAVNWYKQQKRDHLAQIRQDWIEWLKAGKNPLADRETFNVLKAQAIVESVAQLNNAEQHEEMVARFREAKGLDPNVVPTMQDSGVLNNVCWWGSLFRLELEVQDACERAVMLAPADGGIIDSRGLNRALLGDFPGAIADFQIAVDWFTKNQQSETKITKRENWITMLRKNQNPFDTATLEALKSE